MTTKKNGKALTDLTTDELEKRLLIAQIEEANAAAAFNVERAKAFKLIDEIAPVFLPVLTKAMETALNDLGGVQ